MGPFSEAEVAALKVFKIRIEDLLPEISEFLKKDIHLLRWLRARGLNVDKAEAMIRKSVIWRRENDVANVFEWKFPDILTEELPWKCCGYDRDDIPVVIIPFGKWNLRKVVELGFKVEFLLGGLFCNEWQMTLMEHKSTENRIISQAVQIIDMEGYSFRQFMSKQTVDGLAEEIQSMEANYPEILKAVYIINAPKIFTLLFALIKPLLAPETFSKVNIYDSNSNIWKTALLERIDPDHLPSEYGGANTNCENFDDMMPVLDPSRIQPNFVNFEEKEFKKETVAAGDCLKVDVDVSTDGSILSWAFKTDEYCIGFSIINEHSHPFVNSGNVDSYRHMQKGNFLCREKGKFILCFDNTFDKKESKKLQYAVSFKIPVQPSSVE